MELIRMKEDESQSNQEVISIHSGIWMTLFFVWFIAAGTSPFFRLPEPFDVISATVSGIVTYLFIAFLISSTVFVVYSILYIKKEGWGVKVWLFPLSLSMMLVVTILALV